MPDYWEAGAASFELLRYRGILSHLIDDMTRRHSTLGYLNPIELEWEAGVVQLSLS